MTFGKWLTVGIEFALFIMGMTAFDILRQPGALALTGIAMMLTGAFYTFCDYETR